MNSKILEIGRSLTLILTLNLLSSAALATALDNGVPLTCAAQADRKIGRNTDYSRLPVCRSRKNTNQEHYTYCDGSSCTGFTATHTGEKNCLFSNEWSGQDDQDPIDQLQWPEDCLVEADFSKWVVSPKTDLNSKVLPQSTEIRDSSLYKLVGHSEDRSLIDIAEAIGKQIRQSYYKQSYKVDAYSYKVVTFWQAADFLRKSEGEFKGFTKAEIDSLQQWVSSHSAFEIVRMKLETSYMSGTGLEDNLIFIPAERYKPVLVVKRFYYSE